MKTKNETNENSRKILKLIINHCQRKENQCYLLENEISPFFLRSYSHNKGLVYDVEGNKINVIYEYVALEVF